MMENMANCHTFSLSFALKNIAIIVSLNLKDFYEFFHRFFLLV